MRSFLIILSVSLIMVCQFSEKTYAFGGHRIPSKPGPAPAPPPPSPDPIFEFDLQTLDGDPWRPIAGSSITVVNNQTGQSFNGVGSAVGLVAFSVTAGSYTVSADAGNFEHYQSQLSVNHNFNSGDPNSQNSYYLIYMQRSAPPQNPSSDGIDLSQAAVFSSPGDVATWPITTKITAMISTPEDIDIEFTKKDGPGMWQDEPSPGMGPLQFTIWIALKINGQWSTAGILQMWHDRDQLGNGGIQGDQIRKNWLYDPRWGPMYGYQPAPGELVGFFVTAGNARDQSGPTSLRERSNIVIVPFPGDTNATFSF